MSISSNYEDLPFEHVINVIRPEAFPQSYPLHWHNDVEMIILPESTKIEHSPHININCRDYELKSGDILFIWSGELHEISCNRDRNILGLQFPASLLVELPDFIPYMPLFRATHQINLSGDSEFTLQTGKYLTELLSLFQARPAFCDVQMLIAFYRIFMELGTYLKTARHTEPDPNIPESGKTVHKINLACSYIQENCEQDLCLDTLADYTGFSSCYFSRAFKQLTGSSFLEYLTMQRLKHAQLLLSDFALPITEIAYQSGFGSIATFNRAFRRYRGCSPTEYRKYYHSQRGN